MLGNQLATYMFFSKNPNFFACSSHFLGKTDANQTINWLWPNVDGITKTTESGGAVLLRIFIFPQQAKMNEK